MNAFCQRERGKMLQDERLIRLWYFKIFGMFVQVLKLHCEDSLTPAMFVW